MIAELQFAYNIDWWGLPPEDQTRALAWALARRTGEMRGLTTLGMSTVEYVIVENQRTAANNPKKPDTSTAKDPFAYLGF